MTAVAWVIAVLIVTTSQRVEEEGGKLAQWVLWPPAMEKSACLTKARELRGTDNGLNKYRVTWADAGCVEVPLSDAPKNHKLLPSEPPGIVR